MSLEINWARCASNIKRKKYVNKVCNSQIIWVQYDSRNCEEHGTQYTVHGNEIDNVRYLLTIKTTDKIDNKNEDKNENENENQFLTV